MEVAQVEGQLKSQDWTSKMLYALAYKILPHPTYLTQLIWDFKPTSYYFFQHTDKVLRGKIFVSLRWYLTKNLSPSKLHIFMLQYHGHATGLWALAKRNLGRSKILEQFVFSRNLDRKMSNGYKIQTLDSKEYKIKWDKLRIFPRSFPCKISC